MDRNPNNAARVAIQAYEFVKSELEKDNLKVSPQCGGQADPTGTPPCRRPKGARRDEGFRSRLQTADDEGPGTESRQEDKEAGHPQNPTTCHSLEVVQGQCARWHKLGS